MPFEKAYYAIFRQQRQRERDKRSENLKYKKGFSKKIDPKLGFFAHPTR